MTETDNMALTSYDIEQIRKSWEEQARRDYSLPHDLPMPKYEYQEPIYVSLKTVDSGMPYVSPPWMPQENVFSPENIELFKAVVEVLSKKARDYNASRVNEPGFRLDDPRPEYFPFKDESYAHMLWTKVQRIVSLVKKKAEGQEPNFEGIEDSLIDLVSYASFYYSFLKDQNGGQAE